MRIEMLRESGEHRPTPIGEFGGVSKASALRAALEQYDTEYYRALGQVVPRRRWLKFDFKAIAFRRMTAPTACQ